MRYFGTIGLAGATCITAAAPPTAGRFQLVSDLAVSDSAPIPEEVSCLLQSEGNKRVQRNHRFTLQKAPAEALVGEPLAAMMQCQVRISRVLGRLDPPLRRSE